MCPVLASLPFLVIFMLIYGINKLFRRRKISPDGKTVLITGCDRGFGETLATRLATDGYTVYAACLDKYSEGARALGTNPNITVLQINVTKQSDVDAAARQLNQDLWERGLWSVVNNAGVAVFAETEWCTMEAYQRVIDVNLTGMIRVTKAFLPLVRRAKGRIVNISSLAGRCSLPGFTAYSASKFGIIGFSDSLRREMKKFDVKVITIEPRLYRTAIADRDYHRRTNEQMWSETSDIVRLEYGDTYFHAFLEMMMKGLRMSSRRTYQVISDLEHAVTAKYPYTRYVPGLKTFLLSEGLILQSNYIQDKFINRLMKVKCIPFMMRKRTVRTRYDNSTTSHLS